MIPTMIVAIVLLAVAVVYQEYRLRQLLRTSRAAEKVSQQTTELAVCAHNMPVIPLPSEDAALARQLVELLFPVHAWHGVPPGDRAPEKVNAVVEIVPEDRVKFELDKHTGMLCLDRPQLLVNGCPVMYGFVPRTLCAEQVGKHCCDRTNRSGIDGDGDPIDICILTEKDVSHGNILVRARPIGGLRMIDDNKADDKIIAVLDGDPMYGSLTDVSELKPYMVDRLRNYFLTYKQPPGEGKRKVEITDVYGREEAQAIIGYSLQDYRAHYPAAERRFEQLVQLIVGHLHAKA